MRDIDKFRGCLIGGAAGDALGYSVEFSSAERIFAKYGENGITEYSLVNGVAEISDDTQMTLFTANGLLVHATREKETAQSCIYKAYLDWLSTQIGTYPASDAPHISWLLNDQRLFSRRAPGNTCLSALSSGKMGTIREPINRSKGCGGIMRVAPIGLYYSGSDVSIEESDQIAAEAAAITHGHELGYLSAAALAHIVRRLTENESETVLSAVTDAMRVLPMLIPETEHLHEMLELMQKAIGLADTELDDLDAIRQLGGGWVGEETLAIAIYCAVKYENDFEKAMIASVNHDGDSDSTGAVTGNILGARLGYDAIPLKFDEKLELRDVILEIADDLYCAGEQKDKASFGDPRWVGKYGKVGYTLR